MGAATTTKGYLSDPLHAVLRRRTAWHRTVREIVFYFLTHTSAAKRRQAWRAALAGEPGTTVRAFGHSDAAMLATEVLRLSPTNPRSVDTADRWFKRAASEGPLHLTQCGKGDRGAVYTVLIDLAPLAAARAVTGADRPPKRRRPGDRRGDNVKARQAQATARRKVRERLGAQPDRDPTNTRPIVAAADASAPDSLAPPTTTHEQRRANVPPAERECASACPPNRREPCPPASGTPKTCDSSRLEQQHSSRGGAPALEPPPLPAGRGMIGHVLAWVDTGCPAPSTPPPPALAEAAHEGLILEVGPGDWELTTTGERHPARRGSGR